MDKIKEKSFFKYISKTKLAILFIAIMNFIAHGSRLFNQTVGIDTELEMQIRGYANTISVGRQGFRWLGKILNLTEYNLYWAEILTFAFMIIAPVCFGYMFYLFLNQTKYLNLSLSLFGAIYTVSPLWATQIYFTNQSAQVTFATLLTAIAVIFAQLGLSNFKKYWPFLILSFGLTQFTFSSYQVLIPIYIATVIALFIAIFARSDSNFKEMLIWVGKHIGLFIIDFTVYYTIARLFYMNNTEHLNSQIMWKYLPFKDCLYGIKNDILSSFMRKTPYSSGLYAMFILTFLGILIYQLYKEKLLKKVSGILIILAGIVLAFMPFAMCVVLGHELNARLKFSLPIIEAMYIYLSVAYLPEYHEACTTKKRSFIYFFTTSIILLTVAFELRISGKYCNQIYYTADWMYDYDTAAARKIYDDIEDYVYDNDIDKDAIRDTKFVGYLDPADNASIVRINDADLITLSRFTDNVGTATDHNRIKYYLAQFGLPIEFDYVSDGAFKAYRYYVPELFGDTIDAMPTYPNAGYINYLSDEETGISYLIVKLSSNWRESFEEYQEQP